MIPWKPSDKSFLFPVHFTKASNTSVVTLSQPRTEGQFPSHNRSIPCFSVCSVPILFISSELRIVSTLTAPASCFLLVPFIADRISRASRGKLLKALQLSDSLQSNFHHFSRALFRTLLLFFPQNRFSQRSHWEIALFMALHQETSCFLSNLDTSTVL